MGHGREEIPARTVKKAIIVQTVGGGDDGNFIDPLAAAGRLLFKRVVE